MGNAMPDEIRVSCAARLHLGFLDLHGGLGRSFGSLGLALDAPVTRLSLRRAGITTVQGADRERCEQILAIMTDRFGVPGGHSLVVAQAVPPHAGLGSGTQLALGVAAAFRRMHGIEPDPVGDARLLGRGRRSGIGIGLFRHGGLVVDGGTGAGSVAPPVLARMSVPESWRVLLLIDRSSEGLSGSGESAAFAALAPMSAATSGEICRLVLMRALPGVAEDDLEAFGGAVSRIQEIIGDHFAPAQGGRFSNRAIGEALATLRDGGATGIGQSSWGPTGFAFVRGDAEASRLERSMRAELAGRGIELMIRRALDHGAIVTAH